MEAKKELLLITLANSLYRDRFSVNDYNVTEINPTDYELNLNTIKNKTSIIAIIEFVEDSLKTLEPVLENLIKKNARIVAISGRISENIRKYLFSHGIPEALESNAAGRIANYINITKVETSKKLGKILVLSDDSKKISILKTIIERFNFTSIALDSIDELLEISTESNVQLILTDLGIKNLEITGFVRKFMTRKNKNIPVIPFKDTYQGLFIHEMISGLNRIAKAILTPEEVYSFLIDILFRKELIPDIELLNNTVSTESLQKFSYEPLNRIYNQMGLDIFQMSRIVTNEKFNILNGRLESLKNLITKTDGLKWLVLPEEIRKPSIGLI